MRDAQFNRFEKARIIGSRALQVAMGAPIIIDVPNILDPIGIAETEYEAGVIPVTVQERTERQPQRKKPEHVARPRKAASRGV